MTTRPRFESALVTGGAGFIGTRLLPRLARSCDRITVYDNLHPQVHGHDPREPNFGLRCRFVRGDVRDSGHLARTCASASPDLVVHLAAETGTGQSHDEVSHHCHVNVIGTAHLAEAIRALPSKARRVVLASSRAVYGEGLYRTAEGGSVVPEPRSAEAMRQGRFRPEAADGRPLEPQPTPETTPPSPASIYASSKLMQEYIFRQAFDGTPIETVVLRFQNVYGAGQSVRNPYTGVLTIFAQQLQDGKTLEIYEDGEIVRDFVHVTDVARSLVAAAEIPSPPSTALNVGSGRAATIKKVSEILLRLYGRPADAATISGKFRSGDVRHCVADIEAAQRLLGWEPRITLEDGLAELVAWIRAGAPSDQAMSPEDEAPAAHSYGA